MGIYLGLLALIIILPLASRLWPVERSRDDFVLITFGIALFLVYVLRDFSVGRDSPHYLEVYETVGNQELFDASWIWMEWGYVLLMKVSSLLGLPFRAFLMVIYALVEIPLLLFIKRYSHDITLSLIVFMCFQFFVFSMSALRQTLAMSLCLMGYMAAQNNGVRSFLLYLMWVLLATLIHRSAIVFLPVYILMRWKLNFKMVITYVIVVMIALLFNAGLIWGLRAETGEAEATAFQENLSLGAFFWFMLLIAVVTFVLIYAKSMRQQSIGIIGSITGGRSLIPQTLTNHANLFACCLVLQVVFQGFMLMRAATFYQVFLLLVIPNLLDELPRQVRLVARLVIIVGMIVIFYYSTLAINELDIVPFKLGIKL